MSTPEIFPRPLQLNNLAPLDMQPNALAPQEARNLALLGQALEIIEEKDKVLEQEHAKTHQQDQETILSLQKALQALIQQNSQLTQENIILKSQNDQMNTAHEADMEGAKERINTLNVALTEKKKECGTLDKKTKTLAAKVEIYEEAFPYAKQLVGLTRECHPGQATKRPEQALCRIKIMEVDDKLQEQKKKEKEEDEAGKCCIQ